jgi:hypothetical protein
MDDTFSTNLNFKAARDDDNSAEMNSPLTAED